MRMKGTGDYMENFRLGKYSDADAARTDILEKDLCALFLYAKTVLIGGERKYLSDADHSVRTVAVSGEMYVPVSFLADSGTAEVDNNRITAGDNTLTVTAGSSECLLNGKTEQMAGIPLEQNGLLYVPLMDVCRLLSIEARCYDGKLAVLADSAVLDELNCSENLRECLTYRIFGDYDAKNLTSEDMRIVKDKWRELLVGNPEVNDLSDPYVVEKIKGVDAACESHLARMNRGEDAVILFGTEAPSVSADLLIQYSGVLALARAYGTYGSRYYHNESIRDDALYGLKWMYEHMYGEAEMEERGWRSAHDYDWWHWYVGGVEPMTDAMLILEDFLTAEQKNTYLRCFRWVMTFMRTGYHEAVAMSRIRVCTKAALLTEDRDMLYDRYLDYDLLLTSDRTCAGIRKDFIAWTHTYPYNMMYGFNHLSRTMFMGAMLAGTPAEFPCHKQYVLFEAAKYMFEPLIYRGRGPRIFNGRGFTQQEWSLGANTVRWLLPMLGFFGADEDAHLKRMIKRNSCMPEIVNTVRRACSFKELYIYNSILADESVDGSMSYEIAHSYYTADRAVQQKNDYSFIVALSSDRHPAYESINGSNKLGWYTGDGALYLYTRNDPYAYDPESFMYNEKCAYNIPGTTVDIQKRIPWSHRSGLRGSCDFVGTMKVGDSYIAAAMDYAAYNYNGKTEPPTDSAYGGGFLKHKNDLTARKAYFCLDDGCLMLGAGITSTTGYPVKTVVENRALVKKDENGSGREKTATNLGEFSESDFPQTTVSGVRWANIEDTVGYVFLEPAVLSVEKYSLTGGASYTEGGKSAPITYDPPRRFFNISIEHGANPKDASYAYMVLPYADEEKLAQFAENPDVRIISNTAALQAIAYDKAKTCMYIFYEVGACDGIRVSAPCMISVEEMDGMRRLSVCEPTQKLPEIIIRVSGNYRTEAIQPEVQVISGEETEIRVNTEGAYGYNFRIDLVK